MKEEEEQEDDEDDEDDDEIGEEEQDEYVMMRPRWLRIDGSVSDARERQARVHRFNRSASKYNRKNNRNLAKNNKNLAKNNRRRKWGGYHVMLLTTGVGGVGLTLTGADR